MIQQTIDELRALKRNMIDESCTFKPTNDTIYTLDKAIIACEQLRKARKKAKRWKRKCFVLKQIYDECKADRSSECDHCKYFDEPLQETCKKCYHFYPDKFKADTKGVNE